MPDYKRQKFKKSSMPKRKHINYENKINMTPKKQSQTGVVPEDNIKVVRGTKYRRKQQTKVLIFAIIFISLVYIILSALLPGGLYENIANYSSLLGHGSFPVSVSGSNVLNTVSNGSYFYVLTDTNITAYANSGKIVFSELHGLSNPVLSVSATRALVYDQGGKSLYLYNLSGKIHDLQTKNEIITASISTNGDFVVATHSDSYTSVVTVYNSNYNEIYAWNSAKELINNVLINPSGNKLAVSTLNVISGQYRSKLMVLDFESADPLHTLDLGTSLALSITNTGKGISIICDNKYKFLQWSKFTTSELVVSGEINSFKNSKSGVLLTVNRANDRSDNTIILISKKGEKTSEFKINSAISDVQYEKGRLYSVCDTTVNILDKNGNILKTGTCNYQTQAIAVLSANSIAAVSDCEIIKINIQEGEN